MCDKHVPAPPVDTEAYLKKDKQGCTRISNTMRTDGNCSYNLLSAVPLGRVALVKVRVLFVRGEDSGVWTGKYKVSPRGCVRIKSEVCIDPGLKDATVHVEMRSGSFVVVIQGNSVEWKGSVHFD